MTRVRAEDYEDKKHVILEKAAAVIAQKGFDVATMMDVAEACRTSKSHLYHYFPSKEDLLYAIVLEYITQQTADLVRIVAQPEPAIERFDRFVESFMQGAARSRSEHVILMNDLKFLPRVQREAIRKFEVEITDLMVGLLREINPQRMADKRRQKPYALLLFGMMIWTFTWYRRSGPVSPQALARQIADVFSNGFRHAP